MSAHFLALTSYLLPGWCHLNVSDKQSVNVSEAIENLQKSRQLVLDVGIVKLLTNSGARNTATVDVLTQ